jgi:O-antigen/teichoic acid export membrane protein
MVRAAHSYASGDGMANDSSLLSGPKRLWSLCTGAFARNVAVVAGGTAIAQLVGILLTPLITRIYGPAAYGELSVFTSILNVGASVATLGFYLAIVLPKREAAAAALFRVCVATAVLVAIAFTAVLLIARPYISGFGSSESFAYWIWLLPIGIVLLALVQALEQWHIRNRSFKRMSFAAVLQAICAGVARVSAGLVWATSTVLIVTGVIARAVQVGALWFSGRESLVRAGSRLPGSERRRAAVFAAVARRHKDFPIFRAPQILLNTVSRAAPIALLASFFGAQAAAFYAIAQSVLYLPVALIAQSTGRVFLQRLAEKAHAGKPLRRDIVRATSILAGIGIIPFGLIGFFGPQLFEVVFGAEWFEAGQYARWLALWVFLNFINIPAVQSLALSNSQNVLLVWEILTTVTKIAILFAASEWTNSPILTVASYAVFGAFAYVPLIAIGIVRAGDLSRIRSV